MDPTESTPIEKFRTDATKRARLRALLDDPVLREAMDLADDEMRPRAGGHTDTNQPLSIAKFHQSAGAGLFISKLRDLTKEIREVTPVKPKALARTLDDLPKDAE